MNGGLLIIGNEVSDLTWRNLKLKTLKTMATPRKINNILLNIKINRPNYFYFIRVLPDAVHPLPPSDATDSRLSFGDYDQEAPVCVLLRWWLGRCLSHYGMRSVGATGQAKTCRAHAQAEGNPHLRAAVTLSSCWQGTRQQGGYC